MVRMMANCVVVTPPVAFILVTREPMIAALLSLARISSTLKATGSVITRVSRIKSALKAGLCPGESIVVSGATGAYGSAAVIVALAMGAARVVAFGRDEKILAQVAALDSHRVVPCTATGDVKADAMALRAAAGRAPSMAFDQVGAARDPNTTLAALNSLAQGGRLVLMGSMTVDLPISYTHMMMNSWQIMGQFMYPREAYGQLLSMIRSRQLHLDGVRPVSFPLHSLRDAMKRAAHTTPFECVVMKH